MSYSEIATLSHCEKKWKLIYDPTAERPENEPSDAMELGSEMHALLGNWWRGDDYLCTDDETAAWLMGRYHEMYMNIDHQPLQMEAIEVPFAVKYYGRWIFGWFDGLVRNIETGELWIAEFKTMSNWSKLDQLPVDKQVTLYIWAARCMGLDVKGVMFDAIRTYRWTGKNKEEHPAEESFRREWVERTTEQMDEFEQELEAAISLKTDLFYNLRPALRNVGQGCSWCSVMPQCYGIELELDESF